jgi:hypothetical protein
MSDQQTTRPCVTHHHACDCREAAHAAEVARLRAALRECAGDLEDELKARYGSPPHPAQLRRYERDMETVTMARRLADEQS